MKRSLLVGLILGLSAPCLASDPLTVEEAQQRLAERQKVATTRPADPEQERQRKQIQAMAKEIEDLKAENAKLRHSLADAQKEISKQQELIGHNEQVNKEGLKVGDSLDDMKAVCKARHLTLVIERTEPNRTFYRLAPLSSREIYPHGPIYTGVDNYRGAIVEVDNRTQKVTSITRN